MSNALIQVQGLNSFYGASHILRNIDFKVNRGETIGLMGRNGMGKSTLQIGRASCRERVSSPV